MNNFLTFVRFTMLAVLFIILFTMDLRYVNFRDRNYYSVLLNTFNIFVDAKDTGQNNSENVQYKQHSSRKQF